MMGNSFGQTPYNDSVPYMEELHDDVLIQIFIRLRDPKSLAVCTLVCRRWATILVKNSSSFWITKCKFDGITIPKSLLTKDYTHRIDFCLIWLKNPYGRNLIKNDSGKEGFKHWEYSPAHWKDEQRIIGEDGGAVMRPIEKPPRMADSEVEYCFATSYFDCSKRQKVDLVAEGIEPWILDEIKPTISVSELHAAARDCGSKYNLAVRLLNSDGEQVGETFNDERIAPQWSDGRWEKSSNKFTGYPDSVRYVEFYSSGVDTQFWAGFFGSKMAKASVIVDIE